MSVLEIETAELKLKLLHAELAMVDHQIKLLQSLLISEERQVNDMPLLEDMRDRK